MGTTRKKSWRLDGSRIETVSATGSVSPTWESTSFPPRPRTAETLGACSARSSRPTARISGSGCRVIRCAGGSHFREHARGKAGWVVGSTQMRRSSWSSSSPRSRPVARHHDGCRVSPTELVGSTDDGRLVTQTRTVRTVAIRVCRSSRRRPGNPVLVRPTRNSCRFALRGVG
jgi:hypothetical protein